MWWWCSDTQLCPTLVTPWTVASQAPLSMGFSRHEYWRGLPCPPPGDLSNLGMDPRSPTLHTDCLPAKLPRKPKNTRVGSLFLLQGSSQPRNPTCVSCIMGRFFTSWATREAINNRHVHISLPKHEENAAEYENYSCPKKNILKMILNSNCIMHKRTDLLNFY